jgi:hypothetical protein
MNWACSISRPICRRWSWAATACGGSKQETNEVLEIAREKAGEDRHRIALVGILPTLTREHLSLESMVPTARYFALNEALLRLRGSNFRSTSRASISSVSTTTT